MRKLLWRALGTERYLAYASRLYLSLEISGLNWKRDPELFFLKRLVRPGDRCLDIGAYLGYYTVFLSRLCGPQGRVWAVEPVPLFSRILRRNAAAFAQNNIRIFPFALGAENRQVRMGTPDVPGQFGHGRTRVVDDAPAGPETVYLQFFDAEMRTPGELLREVGSVDFIKCDVEGYELNIFPRLQAVLRRSRPTVQVEINTAKNRAAMLSFMDGLGYAAYGLRSGDLMPLPDEEALSFEESDFYFLPRASTRS